MLIMVSLDGYHNYIKSVIEKLISIIFPHGLMVTIYGFHPSDPGSIPGGGIIFERYYIINVLSLSIYISFELSNVMCGALYPSLSLSLRRASHTFAIITSSSFLHP